MPEKSSIENRVLAGLGIGLAVLFLVVTQVLLSAVVLGVVLSRSQRG